MADIFLQETIFKKTRTRTLQKKSFTSPNIDVFFPNNKSSLFLNFFFFILVVEYVSFDHATWEIVIFCDS